MSNTALTLTSKTKLNTKDGKPLSFAELMSRELSNLDWTKAPEMQDRAVRPENIEKNTSREFKPDQVQFLSEVLRVYRTLFVTRQMVVAVNMAGGHVSCPNYLNKNDFCRTKVRGLYKLPEWALPKDLVKEVRAEMKARAEEYRKAMKEKAIADKKAAAEKAAAEKAAETSKETSEEKPKKTSKKAAKKTSKKKGAEAIEAVEPAANEPAEIEPPADDLNETLAETEAKIEGDDLAEETEEVKED